MKKLCVLTWLMIVSFMPVNSMAGDAADETILGAIGGAALGQAIGRDTEATLVGAALGSVFGYMIGSESDGRVYASGGVAVNAYPQRVYPYPYYGRNYIDRRWVVQDYYRPYPRPSTVIVNKTVIKRPHGRHGRWEKNHHKKWNKRNKRHHDRPRHYAKNNYRHDRDKGYRGDKRRGDRYERRQRW